MFADKLSRTNKVRDALAQINAFLVKYPVKVRYQCNVNQLTYLHVAPVGVANFK